ncbi:secreted RxLR effector protein 161-like [Benincasa hispida]|uniref:secreted RxLR effector protein 161-like n=1 Tax=Benincasa hispida TaxID=102211 RepID=UPI00190010E0|nr:secreted RxLR effector protein 161-like [Benincasa hispida]
MDGAKLVRTPLVPLFKLSAANSPKSIDEDHINHMKVVPYSQDVGHLMYLMTSTRSDLSYATSLVSRYMSSPSKRYWEATKWILRYLCSSKEARILYKHNDPSNDEMYGYMDADYAGDLDRRRSLSGYVFLCGNNLINSKASLQSIVALSTTEAKFIALSEVVKEGLWLKGLLNDFGITQARVRIEGTLTKEN